jgi:hypothetical protein
MLLKAILANTLVPFSVDDVVESLSQAVATHTSSTWTWMSTQRVAASQRRPSLSAQLGAPKKMPISAAGGTGAASGSSYSATLNLQVHFMKPVVRITIFAQSGHSHLRVPPGTTLRVTVVPLNAIFAFLAVCCFQHRLPLFSHEGFPCRSLVQPRRLTLFTRMHRRHL